MNCTLFLTLFILIIILFNIFCNNEKFNAMEYRNALKSCIVGNSYFIYNKVGNNYYFLKKDKNTRKLIFEKFQSYCQIYRDESFKFEIVPQGTNNIGGYFRISLPNIDSSYSDIFRDVYIPKPNHESTNDKEIKYYIKSKDTRFFLMNKNTCTGNVCSLSPNHTINNIIYRPEEVCRGDGNGDPTIDSNYQYSPGLSTDEDPNRDRSILVSQSGMCPRDKPYPVNTKTQERETDFQYLYDVVNQRVKCSSQEAEAPFYIQEESLVVPCISPPCKSFNVPEGKCFTIHNDTVTIKEPSDVTNDLVETTPNNTINNSEIEGRKLFNIVCSNDDGRIDVDEEGISSEKMRPFTNIKLFD